MADDDADDLEFAGRFPANELAGLLTYMVMAALACQHLLRYDPDHPVRAEVERLTGLTEDQVNAVATVQDPRGLQQLWTNQLVAYYYTLLVGRLVLESPLLEPIIAAICPPDSEQATQYRELMAATCRFSEDMMERTEQMLCGLDGDADDDELPPDERADREAHAREAALRRAYLEGVFLREADSLRVSARATPPAPPAPAPYVPDRRGKPLTLPFNPVQHHALLFALLLPKSLALLVEDHPFTQAFPKLGCFQPPARVAALRKRLVAVGPDKAVKLTRAEVFTICQVLQATAMLLLSDAFTLLLEDMLTNLTEGKTFRSEEPDGEPATADDVRQTLSDETSITRIRECIAIMAESFTKGVQRRYPRDLELAQAQQEVTALADLL